MAYSAWHIFLHPVRTGRELEETLRNLDSLQEDNSRLQEALTVAETRISELERDAEVLRQELADAERKRVDASRAAEELWAKLRKENEETGRLRKELSKRLEAEEQIKIFESKLGKFEDFKKKYEDRIDKLRKEIRLLRERRVVINPESEELREIDMQGPVPVMHAKTGPHESDDGDWLKSLSD